MDVVSKFLDAYGLRFLRDGSSILLFIFEFVLMIFLDVGDPNENVALRADDLESIYYEKNSSSFTC